MFACMSASLIAPVKKTPSSPSFFSYYGKVSFFRHNLVCRFCFFFFFYFSLSVSPHVGVNTHVRLAGFCDGVGIET